LKQRGIVYDVGRTLSAGSINWRPDYSPGLIRRELEIIRADLHANAVRICGRDPGRLLHATEQALSLGLEVWLGPELWNATPESTVGYLAEVADGAERLRQRWPDQLTFSVGNELTLFMRGIVPGRSFARRAQIAVLRDAVRSGRHISPLRAFLTDAAAAVRRVYHGPISYCALAIESVDWDLFDVIGINHYRNTSNAQRYPAVLERLLATGKPVTVTEFGFPACRDAEDPEMLRIGLNASAASFLASQMPTVGHLVQPRVRAIHQRDEALQARLLVEQLALLEEIGVDGAFIMSFSFPLATYSTDPRHDLDATALSIVRTLPHGQHGITYPDLAWEPKQAFHAIADYYASQSNATP
jgi:hypothetical protein